MTLAKGHAHGAAPKHQKAAVTQDAVRQPPFDPVVENDLATVVGGQFAPLVALTDILGDFERCNHLNFRVGRVRTLTSQELLALVVLVSHIGFSMLPFNLVGQRDNDKELIQGPFQLDLL